MCAFKVVVECDVDDDEARVPVEGDHLIVRTLPRGTPAQLESGTYTSRDSAEGLHAALKEALASNAPALIEVTSDISKDYLPFALFAPQA